MEHTPRNRELPYEWEDLVGRLATAGFFTRFLVQWLNLATEEPNRRFSGSGYNPGWMGRAETRRTSGVKRRQIIMMQIGNGKKKWNCKIELWPKPTFKQIHGLGLDELDV